MATGRRAGKLGGRRPKGATAYPVRRPRDEATRTHSVLATNYHHYTVPLCVGPTVSSLRAMHPTLDTGAGVNLIREDMLPQDWRRFAFREARRPRVVDANGNPLLLRAFLYLFVDTGAIKMMALFHVTPRMAVPDIPGIRFINEHVLSIYPRRHRVYWAHTQAPTNPSTPVLSVTRDGVNTPTRSARPSKVA